MMRLLINARQAAANITLLADSSCQFHAHDCNLQLLGRKTKRPLAAASCLIARNGSALTSLEARIALADHEHLAAATHDFAVTVALLGGFKRGQDFHVDLPTKVRAR
jgi:hypothetical protein